MQDISEVVPEILPARVGPAADAVDGRTTQVSILAWVVNQVRVHEQDLIARHEIFPRIISVRLRRTVPHPEVAVVAVIDVDFAGRSAGSARIAGRSPNPRGDPVGIGVVEDRIRGTIERSVSYRVLIGLPFLIRSDKRNKVVIPPD